MEEERLTIAGTGLQRIDLRIHVTVGDKKVQPGVVVHVKEGRTPAHVRIAGLADSGGPTHIVEYLGINIAIQRIRLLFKVSNKKAQATAVVVVTEIHSHVPKFQTFATQRNTGQQADVNEYAIMIVMIQIVGYRVVGDQEIGPAIVIVIGPHHAQAVIANV